MPDLQRGVLAPPPQASRHRRHSEMVSSQSLATGLLLPLPASLPSPHFLLPQLQTSVSPTLPHSYTEASKIAPDQNPIPTLGCFNSWLTSPEIDASSCILPSPGVSALEKLANDIAQRCPNSSPQLKHVHSLPCPASPTACCNPQGAPSSQSYTKQSYSPCKLAGRLQEPG